MLPSLKIGRLFGIPVYLHSTLILLPAWVAFNWAGHGWQVLLFMLVGTALLFGCVLLHEFGHVLMARWFGVATRDVTLYPIGGIARLERMAEKPIEEIFIALAGPAVNVLIGALLTPLVLIFALNGVFPVFEPTTLALTDTGLGWAGKFCGFLWLANIMLVVFNMIPAFPMDGGRVLRALLAHFFGLLRGTEIAVPIGITVVMLFALGMMGMSAVAGGSLNPMPLIIAAFISLMGRMELQALRYREQQKREAASGPQPQPLNADTPYTPLPYPDEDEMYRPTPTTPVPAVQLQQGFTGFTWDREFGVWVKWQNGRRVAAYWSGPE